MGISGPAALLSLLGSGSILAVTSRQRRCCHIQLRPLFLLALADFLAAAALLGTATMQLLPAPLSVPAYPACPYGRMLVTALPVSLQGFLHSLVYGWMRENFRREVLGRTRTLQRPRGLSAFYDESLGLFPELPPPVPGAAP
ncbi:hypothetical protein WISP_60492 [Willisornis vidua]|uniref:G-protein coupled receptors family 1 profile domain-containing protein n=1 Tax=Willisornis vidua TaxID=1566151 RepID=A0ABQ9DFV0_9PASS|nr:hypothetical protein WISP_60492 [Willisornis vidua]